MAADRLPRAQNDGEHSVIRLASLMHSGQLDETPTFDLWSKEVSLEALTYEDNHKD
jgi:hypothetical protein